jgi:hypothetical protein
VQTDERLRAAGYTEPVVYMTQQIRQFALLDRSFAMQHLGADDEMRKVLRSLLDVMTVEDRLAGLSPEERLKGMSLEDRLKGLFPEELQQLKDLAQQQTKVDDNSNPK